MANLKDLFMQIDENPAGDYDDSSIEVYADSVRQALELAARELDVDISQLDYEVVEKGTKGFLGFGRLPYRVIITPLGWILQNIKIWKSWMRNFRGAYPGS
jgi:hypothetical protein